MPKRKCNFTSDIKRDYPFLKETIDSKVLCNYCQSVFSIRHGGRSDIKDHLETKKHKSSLEAVTSSDRVTNFFKAASSEESLLLAAKEATFAYHTAVHGQSFKSSDCTSKLVSKLFQPKFALRRTKCEAVLTNCIAPMIATELRQELNKANFISASIDASNRKEIKIVPVVVRYFVPDVGVKVKLLEFKSLEGETAAILSEYLVSVLEQNGLKEKLAGFCADNCNTNFGGLKRRGQNNVFFKLKENIGRNLIGVGCAAHIVHNCIQHAVDNLPVPVESLVVKIYKFFHIYTVRVTELKQFCDFVDIEYQSILQHGNTRFLSLLPALQRILEMFEGLRSYFNSQEGCPTLIKNCFEDPTQELYLKFVHGQLKYFNQTILKLEKESISAVEVVLVLSELKQNLLAKKENNFLPSQAMVLLSKLEEEGEVNVKRFYGETRNFYDKCISYLGLYNGAYEDLHSHCWVDLKEELSWAKVLESTHKINIMFKKKTIDSDSLFDEEVLVKKLIFECCEEDSWQKASLEQKWVQIFKKFEQKDIGIPNFRKLIECIFSLPGTSAPVERIFSIMNNIWSDHRSKMLEQNVKALITCKTNSNLSCCDFYEKVKSNKTFLKKVLCTEKYDWANV